MTDQIARLNGALEGRYRIEHELGEGGMATVYLADDLKHERKIALKVLKPELAAVMGAERFLAEIKTTANLQHPHILPLHDSGEADGFLFYVMPYVEGETLRDRLDREKQLPVDEAVKVATDVAEALQAAHDQGVIHRDVKPANILMSAGRPLVADFGIALAVSAAGGGRLTETGLSMGTPYYMSPEQAAADREPTPASDVYSLGCVLYEMLVGEPPHTGSSAQAVLAKILTEDAPHATRTRASIPANVDAAIRKALQKLPADRFSSARDFARALEDPSFGGDRLVASADAASPGPWKPIAMGAGAAALLLGGALVWSLLRPTPPQPVSRYSLDIWGTDRGPWDDFALAPDGAEILYVGDDDTGRRQLFLRRRDQLVSTPVPGTGGAINASLSPDGQRFAFVDAERTPRTLFVGTFGGGPPVARTDSLVDRGGVGWGYDGYIYYDGRLEGDGIARIAEGGDGSPEIVSMPRVDDGELYHIQPHPLPDGRGLLVTISLEDGWGIGAVDLTTGEHRLLETGAVGAIYSPTGHVLYVALDGTLLARPFDADALEFAGDPVAIAGNLRVSSPGGSQVSLSNDGTLVYVEGGVVGNWELVWVTRQGNVRPLDPDWAGLNFQAPALSPDDSRLAITLGVNVPEVWIKRLDQPDVPAQLFETQAGGATWTDGGATLYFAGDLDEGATLHRRPSDGSAPAQPVFPNHGQLWGLTFSEDGSRVAWGGLGDVYAGRVDSLRALEGPPTPLVTSEFFEHHPALSPDGRWLAYTSNTSGNLEVYVCPMPSCEVQHRVSTAGGSHPLWAPGGRELFYTDEVAAMLMEAAVIEGDRFLRGAVRPLFDIRGMRMRGLAQVYDVTSDGERFVMLRLAGADQPGQVIVVENFFEELRARVP